MTIYEDEDPSTKRDDNSLSDQQVPADHPGLQKIAKNENPRANENINDEDSTASSEDDASEQVGSEVTDGEDG